MIYAVWGLAALGCLLGLGTSPPPGPGATTPEQALDLLRILTTVALALTLLLGPGLIWRAAAGREGVSLGHLPLPGLALLILGGLATWVFAGSLGPDVTAFVVFGPLLGLILGALLGAPEAELTSGEERGVLLVVGCALGLAISRAVWSLGPEGELYGGGISRTLEVGDRSDSRISFIVPQAIEHDATPYSPVASALYAPYNFSSRGPLAGLASAPIVMLSGGHPPPGLPEEAWRPFDPQGFMAYRLAMMAFAATAFLALWDLTKRIGGSAAARFAVVLAATTPFLVHEVWFTWPKMVSAAFALLAAIAIVERRPLRAGLLLGVGYLMHPGALLALAALGLIALWPLRGARWNRPRIGDALALVGGVAVAILGWRLINGSHYTQSGFTDYFRQAGSVAHPGLGEWLDFRLDSIANTLIPLYLPLTSSDNGSINAVFSDGSPAVIHFFFQYWNGVPFGLAIVFFPLLLISLGRAARRWPWPFAAVVAIPFLAFAAYWGATVTGTLREGLHFWILTLFVVVAIQQARTGFPWLRSKPIRGLLTLRVAELLLICLAPTLLTTGGPLGDGYSLNDAVALLAMAGFAGALAAIVWRTTPESLAPDEPPPLAEGPPERPANRPSQPRADALGR